MIETDKGAGNPSVEVNNGCIPTALAVMTVGVVVYILGVVFGWW